MTKIFIQWKGTDVCLDFYCECGEQGHVDGMFVYALRCGACGREYGMPSSSEPFEIDLEPMSDFNRQWHKPVIVDMDDTNAKVPAQQPKPPSRF